MDVDLDWDSPDLSFASENLEKEGIYGISTKNDKGNSSPVPMLHGLTLDTWSKLKNALFVNVQNNKENKVLALIDVGADVNRTDSEGKTALFYAVEQSNNESVVHALIDAGADVNRTDSEGKAALFCAVQQSNNESVVCALIDAGADVNRTDNEGKTALFYAVMNDNTNIAKLLVERGASVNARDIYGRTPLFYAIKSLHLASYLLESGANVHVKDFCNMTILSFLFDGCMTNSGLSFGSPCVAEAIHLVMRHGVHKRTVLESIINVVFCKSPLLFTPENVLTVVVDALMLAKEFAFNIFGKKRRTVNKILYLLKSETSSGSKITKHIATVIPKIMALLVELNANPDSADSDGNTALHYATALPFHDASQEVVMDIISQLESFGVRFNIKNTKGETPLLFCLSNAVQEIAQRKNHSSEVTVLVRVCRFLLEHGSSVEDISRNEESIFHLILELFQQILQSPYDQNIKEVLEEITQILFLVVNDRVVQKGMTVNKTDFHLNSPLHKWASLEIGSHWEYTDNSVGINTFRDVSKTIFENLLKCGAKLNARNENDETPLHLCRTLTAVELLLGAGANPKDLDSSGRTPLLVAAKRKMIHENTGCFYPDTLLQPNDFWRTALVKGLDPWTVDQNGESVLSVLVESNNFALSKALVDVACERDYLNVETIAVSLLNAVCRDKSQHAHWKAFLVHCILKSRRSVITALHIPLHYCCRNILDSESHLHNIEMENPPPMTSEKDSKPKLEGPVLKKARRPIDDFYRVKVIEHTGSVHWTIAKQLLMFGADCNIPDSSGQSCLDIAHKCPALKMFLSSPLDMDDIPLLIPWTPITKIHKNKLAKVARHLECEHVESFWYHKDHLASGSFGDVFAGINEKDGREVAIKRILKIRLLRPEDKREITNLTALADCEQVVRYLYYFEDKDFSYIVLELMEGNLDQLLNNAVRMIIKMSLCQDVVKGLQFLHMHNIIHRDLKPSNILYKTHPKMCLKLADFGLSRLMDSSSTSVYGSNVGTRCWIAPEVLNSTNSHSKSSDVFACGLVLHYFLSERRHPFAPLVGALQHMTEANILNGNMEGWDDSLCPEAAHLLKAMLDGDQSKRPYADEALDHPFFWSKKEKLNFLIAVGNQPEFECPRAKRTLALSAVETDLETSFGTIVKYVDWNDPGYLHMPAIYTEMTRRKRYNTNSVVELVRFIRNAYAHVTESTRPMPIRKPLLEDFVFLEYFPNLVMEVYKAVTTHGWDQTREEIKYAMWK